MRTLLVMMFEWESKEKSGGDQEVILPADPIVKDQIRNLLHGMGERGTLLTLLISTKDGGTTLSGDLIDGDGTIGSGVVTHGMRSGWFVGDL